MKPAVWGWSSVYLGTEIPTFQGNLLPPSSDVKREPEDNAAHLQGTQCRIPRHSFSNLIQLTYTSPHLF